VLIINILIKIIAIRLDEMVQFKFPLIYHHYYNKPIERSRNYKQAQQYGKMAVFATYSILNNWTGERCVYNGNEQRKRVDL
jgi:hypothetical protein